MGKSPYQPIVPAVEQASRVLLCLGESHHFKMSLTDICRRVGIYKSKGYSILSTLSQFGLVEKDPETKTYFLGPNWIFLSRSVLNNMNYLERVTPLLETLSRNTNGTAAFGLIRGSHVFVVATREGNQDMGFRLGVGQRFPITSGASGKAIAAFMDGVERQNLFAKKRLYFYGDPARMDTKRLSEEIATCKDFGFAQDVGEVAPGVTMVSAPVFGLHEKIIGCIILVGTFAEDRIAEYGRRVAGTARQVSHQFGAHVERVHSTQVNHAWHGTEMVEERGFTP